MGRTSGDGTRLLLSSTVRKKRRLNAQDWAKVKEVLGKEIPKTAKTQINNANMHFLRALKDSERNNTVLRSKVEPVINRWSEATQDLATMIGLATTGSDLSRDDVVKRLRQREKSKKLKRRPALSLLAYLIETSLIAAEMVKKEIASPSADVSRSPWIIWVALLAEILKQHDFSASAYSWMTGAQDPKFVQFITLMQRTLGQTYPRSTEESLIDGVKKAKAVWKTFKADELLITLSKWGRQ